MADFLQFETLKAGDTVFAPRLVSFHGREALSQLYHYELELWQPQADPAPVLAKLLGSVAKFSLGLTKAEGAVDLPADVDPAADVPPRRYFSGRISNVQFQGLRHGYRVYRVHISPELWFLARRSNCRIFEKEGQTVGAVIDQILESQRYTWIGGNQSAGAAWACRYAVQYCESDYQFVARMLEEHGITYRFQPLWKEGVHELQLLGDPGQAAPKCVLTALQYRAPRATTASIERWERHCRFLSNKVTTLDSDWGNVESSQSTPARPDIPGNPAAEWLEYPGGLRTPCAAGGAFKDSAALAAETVPADVSKCRMQELETGFDVAAGDSDCRRLFAGGTFLFSDDGAPARAWLVTRVEHRARGPEPRASGPAAGSPAYQNSLECIPYDVAQPYRAPRSTPRPRIAGPQTALVVGSDLTTTVKKGEGEPDPVHTDALGRVRVLFRWQRSGEGAVCSAWVRVSQAWAGNGWGNMYLPSVGDEVVVSFEDGDPDRPLITGRVYNPQRPVPATHPLPDGKYMGVVARDSMGNEIYLDGTKDHPGIAIGGSSKSDDDKTRAAILVGFGAGVNAFTEQASNWITAGSKFEINGGATFEAFVGGACEVFVGDQSAITGGISRELFIGDQSSFAIGSTYEFTLASSLAFKAGVDLEFRVGGGTTVSLASEVGYNILDTGMMSAKGITFLGGLTNRSSVDLTPEGLELRFGKAAGADAVMPILGAVTAGVLTGGMGAVEALGGIVPVVSSGYAAVMQAGAGILDVGISAGTEGGAEAGGVTKGTEGYTGWGAATAKEMSHAVEGFVSGSVLGVAGLAEGTVMGTANLATALATLIILKKLEEKPPQTISGGLRLSEEGALLIASKDLAVAKQLQKSSTMTSYVELTATEVNIGSPMTMNLDALVLNVGKSPGSVTVGASSSTVALKGTTITANSSSLLVT